MRFRLKSGSWSDANGNMHIANTPSAIVESDERLDKKHRNKFEVVLEAGQVSSSPITSVVAPVITDVVSADKVIEQARKVVADAEAKKAEIEAAVAKGAKDILPAAELGMDVTRLFGKGAVSSKFTIHKNGEAFDVYKDGVKVNPDPLTKEVVLMYLKNNA